MTETIKSLDGKTILNIEIGKEMLFVNQKQDDGSYYRVMMAMGDFKQSTNFKLK